MSGDHLSVAGERLALAMQAGHMGTWVWDVRSGELDWDDPLLQVFGLSRDGFAGTFEQYMSLLHPEDREATSATIGESLARGAGHYVEHRVIRPVDGQLRWISGTGRVLLDDDGQPLAMVGVGADITERKLAELRLAFLARAGELLGSTLDLQLTLQQVCDLAVEELADWCSVDLVEDGQIRLVAVAHRDPDKVAYARQLRERFGVDEDAEQGLAAVLRTGQPEVYPDISEEMMREALDRIEGITPDEVQELLNLELSSSMSVPLITATGQVIGALSLTSTRGHHRYDEQDADLAMEVARRAATAVDNARLYEHARHAARTLQGSLLPPALPDSPVADVAAFYLPAASGDLIGGDFYDAWTTRDGALCLLVGDVAGKGIDAAALTAECRWTLRTALESGAGVADAVETLNDLLVAQARERFVTVVVAVLERDGEGALLHCASAGHPRPVVRRADGRTELLPVSGQLAGLFSGPVAGTVTVPLARGDALLLYTDGFTEARTDGHLFGDDGMLTAAAADAENVAALVAALTGAVRAFAEQRDDMALLVAQVRPLQQAAGMPPTTRDSAAEGAHVLT